MNFSTNVPCPNRSKLSLCYIHHYPSCSQADYFVRIRSCCFPSSLNPSLTVWLWRVRCPPFVLIHTFALPLPGHKLHAVTRAGFLFFCSLPPVDLQVVYRTVFFHVFVFVKCYKRVVCNFNYVSFDVCEVKEKSPEWWLCWLFQNFYFVF